MAEQLAPPPTEQRSLELWLQHAVGFILFRDMRGYAREQLAKGLSPRERRIAHKAIDDAIYGLMMQIDGVTGGLENEEYAVNVRFVAELRRRSDDTVVRQLDLFDGDGVCMGYHDWKKGEFGDDPIVAK
jgi:hypothetical protein